jgi:hypothetical protein
LSIETAKEENTPKHPTNSPHISIYLVPFAELSREINSVNLVKVGFGTHDCLLNIVGKTHKQTSYIDE